MKTILLNDITVTQRKRRLNQQKVAELAQSIADIGLLQPIVIDTNNRLVAGYHRLEAVKLLGWQEIEAGVFEGDSLYSELAEIAENAKRNDFSVLEKAEQLHRYGEILEELGLRTKQGDNQFLTGGDNIVTTLKTTADVAADMGLKEREAQRRSQIVRNLDEEVKDTIRYTPLGNNVSQLLELARMNVEDQKQAVELIVNGKATTVFQAKDQITPGYEKTKTGQAVTATIFSHKSLEYYTPEWVTTLAKDMMGSITLDPASCDAAQKWIGADNYYTITDNGLTKEWYGNIWLNPPYSKTDGKSNQAIWADALIQQYQQGEVSQAILLVKAAIGYKWFTKLIKNWPCCLLYERLSFVLENGNDDGQSKQGTALFYFGNNCDRFVSTFNDFGTIILPCEI